MEKVSNLIVKFRWVVLFAIFLITVFFSYQLKFLEVDSAYELESDLVKINPDTLEDVIDNYEEIKDKLSGTPLEKYIY